MQKEIKLILRDLRKDLRNKSDLEFKKSQKTFFKESIKNYGVRAKDVSEINKKYFVNLKEFNKKELFLIIEELLKSDYLEEAFIAIKWLRKREELFLKNDFKIFKSWIDLYINNWAKCDEFCSHVIGSLFFKYPDLIKHTTSWTKSKNRWLRRAAPVSLVLVAREGLHLDFVFDIADLLIEDEDDLVRKGYGWLLKEASRIHEKEVFNYVVKNKKIMPRVSLRYAIELMPLELRKKAMMK